MPLLSIEQAIKDIREGKMVILVDDEDRENEGDLCMAAEKVSARAINFMATHGRGLICLSLTPEKVDELDLPLMVDHNTSPFETGFTISIEARCGVTTGISAADRATTVLAAVCGSAAIMLIMVGASFFVNDSMTLLIIGLMLGSLSGAIVSILQYFSEAQEIQSYLLWTFGNLSGVYGTKLVIMTIVVLFGLLWTLIILKPLNSLLLGEDYATSLGVSVKQTRFVILGITALLAGGITAFCGPLAFVGIAVPHFCRVLFKTSSHMVLFPTCILIGAIVLLLCDTIAQLPGSAQTLPINAITSLIGAPVVIAILLRNRKLGKSFAK